MKVQIIGVNAKYTHTNLAVRYLRDAVAGICDVSVKEYTINDNTISVERDILTDLPDIIAFSCYIWNVEFVLSICSTIKKVKPDIIIILGGPEVSYDCSEILKLYSYIDYIIKGEGEISFYNLISFLSGDSEFYSDGIAYRNNEIICDSAFGPLIDMNTLSNPYACEINDLKGRILYYESSRGCPYSCTYCLSGERGNVRFRDVELVKKDLKFFDDMGVPLVKFVDRTFNADKNRAIEIWRFISTLSGDTRFHMEITGEILDDDAVDAIKSVPPEKLQFEIGVQSTNEATLKAVNRVCNQKRLFSYIKKLLEHTDVHIHLDLIAGLPFEDFLSFKHSFNDVVSLRPHVLQLGFLKLLKGSVIRSEEHEHAMVYRDSAPYEIIHNKYISCEEIIFLKDIDFVFDKVYNSGAFEHTINFLFEHFEDKFEIFKLLVLYFRSNSLINTSFSKAKLYDYVYECFQNLGEDFEENLRYDYIYSMHPGKMPYWSRGNSDYRYSDEVYEFLKNEEIKKTVIPHRYGSPAKSIIKHVRFEKFKNKILMFDYEYNCVTDVTNRI